MSAVPTTNPLYNYSNFLNTAFAIVQNGTFLKITFAAPISQSFQLNEKLFNVKYSDLGANFVDLGEFDWGILTVNYALCTSPVAGSRQAWIDAVIALITNNGGGSSFINSLGTGSTTDVLVGYNTTTMQLTNLGPTEQQGMSVAKTSAQGFPNGSAAATPAIFNVVSYDPLVMYNPVSGAATIQQAGYYTMGYQLNYSGGSQCFSYFGLNGANAVSLDTSVFGPMNGVYGNFLAAGTTIRVYIYANGAASIINTALPNNFWVKRVR